ncbi:MAG: PepSY domain-containing protein, partial [Parvularculaceae bacterium]|nr:PepSY domain-containing protein [Parvularculaceae bacterium]
MRSVMSLLLAFVVAAQAALAMTLQDVPDRVRNAALRAVPGVVLKSVSTEVENGVTIYEFAAEKDGAKLEIDVDEKGELQEVEWPCDRPDLPPKVRETLDRVAPGFMGVMERSERPRGVVVYEFEGVSRGAPVEIE